MTRDRIVKALAELIETTHPLEVTMSAVAEHAGVSEPTLYRHFETKRNLFAALGSELYQETTARGSPTSLDELAGFLPDLFQQFKALEAMVRWNMAAPRDEMVRPSATERMPILRDALAESLEGLPPQEQEFLLRAIVLMTSATTVLYWQDYLQISIEEAAETAEWMLRRLADR
jgi:AcrR family transcriptional regulator